MGNENPHLQPLIAAAAHSPDDPHVRCTLAYAYLTDLQPEAAEREFRAALALAPEDAGIKFGLAMAFYGQSQYPQALVILEDLTQSPGATAAQHTLYARLLFDAGEIASARRALERAAAMDPTEVDDEFAEKLGLAT